MALTDLHHGFRDDEQRERAAHLVRSRLGDEAKREELHSLLRFSSQLSAGEVYVDESRLVETVGPERLAAVEALIRAVRKSPDAIDAWIETTSRSSPLFAAEPRLELQPPAPVPADVSPAPLWAAVEAGIDGAAFRLAELLEHEGELHQAAAMYRLASEAGDVHALYALGRVFWAQDQQSKVEADDPFWLPAWRITEVWQHAADLGFVEAMHAVAMMADRGSGMALRYLRRAAGLGHPPSCYALGYDAAQSGDREEAIRWWTKAADSDYRPAAEALTLLDVYRTPDTDDPS